MTRGADGRPVFDGVDGLRALAAFAVLFHHVGFDTGTTFRTEFVGDLTARGDIGVPIFFAISGFLLYRPFAAARAGQGNRPDTRTFWWRRALRIFPAYWLAVVVLSALFYPTIGRGWAALQQLTLTHIYRPSTALGSFPHSWSLAVELSFYAVLPGYAALITWAARRRPWAPWAGPVVLAATSLAWHAVWELSDPWWKGTALLWLPAHLEAFAIGIALAEWSVAERAGHPRAVAAARRIGNLVWPLWALAVAAYAIVSLGVDLPRGLEPFSGSDTLVRQLLYSTVTIGVLVPTVFAGTSGVLPQRVLRWAPLAWCGVVSYGIYLWHKTISVEMVDWVGGTSADLNGPFVPALVGTAVLSVVVAGLSHRWWEEPVNRLLGRRGIARRRAARPAPSGPS